MSLTRLALVTPVVSDPGPFAPALAAACGGAEVAAVILRLAEADERSLVNRLKSLAPAAQGHGAAVLVEVAGGSPDADLLARLAARGGADGVHLTGADFAGALRPRLGERMLSIGGLATKHEAMTAGEAGADALLFGEPLADGPLPRLPTVIERAGWWAEIFETPCLAYAPDLAAIPPLTATRAEFVALGPFVWEAAEGPAEAVRRAFAALRGTPAEAAP